MNAVFFVFHTVWIAFICTGWAWSSTRRWHLAAVAVTIVSWFGLGARYGWGYCPLTDWHWQVRARLGHQDPPSYIQLLVRELTGFQPDALLADAAAVATLAAAGFLGVTRFTRERREKMRREDRERLKKMQPDEAAAANRERADAARPNRDTTERPSVARDEDLIGAERYPRKGDEE